MKKLIILFAVFLSGLKISNADIIFTPIASIISNSYEWIFSYEKVLGSRTTINYWGGAGVVFSLIMPSTIPLAGVEIGIEPRYYFNPDSYKKSSLSLYGGFAYMKLLDKFYYNDQYVGFVPGLKYTHKSNFTKNEKYFYEPYVSISIPMYLEIDYGFEVMLPCITFGIRLGIQKLQGKI